MIRDPKIPMIDKLVTQSEAETIMRRAGWQDRTIELVFKPPLLIKRFNCGPYAIVLRSDK